MADKENDKLEKITKIVIDNLIEALERIRNELRHLDEGKVPRAEASDAATQERVEAMRKEAERLEATAQSDAIKLTLAGYGAVGKTTLLKLLKGIETPMSYFPTIGASIDCEDLVIANRRINVWDLAGQEHYHRTWPIFMRNTKIALIVTDSTKANVERSKNILNIAKAIEPKAILIGIANKQDLPGALPPKEVESMLGIKTFPCVAIDTRYRDKMIAMIEMAIVELHKRE